ncbi:MAG: PD-(D/E)XK nuclease family protein [Nitrospirae bacterium]|nr:PD-(D/E)XK nuclease family protein [Nitrospirota bacterium]MCL5422654.1 PD-(D/E)XK nuclease family protein [Nitrospirota bacterium]
MKMRVISHGRNLIEEIIADLKGTGKDYSSTAVVFPGKRPSHFLRKSLAARVGSSFIPPSAFSMDEFVDTLCEELAPGRKIETIDAVALLYEIHRKASNPLGRTGFMTPDSFFFLGLKVYGDIEELTIEGVSPHKVKGIESSIADGIPEQTRNRVQSLSFFYEAFYKEMDALGFSTRAMRYRLAAERVDETDLDRYERMIFGGFFALTKAEKVLFQKLLSRDNTLFVFHEGSGLEEKLAELGIRAEGRETEATEPEIHFYSTPDTHGQVLALGKVLERGNASLDEKTVVVLPSSETLFPLMRQGLPAVPEDSYNVSMGYPLHRTPVFGFLNNLMELVTSMDGERVYIPDYLKFVLHPYTKNIYYRGKSETTRIVFHAVEEELLEHKARTFITLAEIEENGKLFEEVMGKLPKDEKGITAERLREHLKAIHRSTIERFLSFKNIRDFAGKCIEALMYIFNNSTARLHPLFHPFSESFITSLDLLPRSLMKDIAFKERSSYFTFFRKYIMTCHTPFAGTPVRGLQVLGFLETRNLKFDRVFVLDANEEVLPDTRKEETLLPFKAREILGLPTYMDRDRLIAYYFDTLLKGAKEVHLFFIENDKTERSRFVEKLLWEKQKRDRATDTKPYVTPIQYQVNLVNKAPQSIPKTNDIIAFLKDLTYSATTMNQYLKCPLQFYYATVLGISRKEEITGDIERDDLGNFVHAVLRRYFSGKKGRPLKEKDMDLREMDLLVEGLFEREYGKDPSGAIYLLKRQIKRHMADFLRDYSIPLVKEKTVTILESEETIQVTVDSFHLKGRLDSVEQRDDKTVIIDYKTGSSRTPLKIDMEKLDLHGRETWNKAIGSLQLPFYLLLYTEKKRRTIDELNALFLLLGRAKISNEIELPLFDDSSPAETFVPLKTVIFKLLGEITDPQIPFLPASDRKKACPPCDYQYICGTQWIVK